LVTAAYLLFTANSQSVVQAMPFMTALLPSVLTVFVVGLFDDLFGLKPWQKLTGQIAAACLACVAGLRMEYLGGHPIGAWLGIPFTIVWLVFCANAMNLIDGVDGLAAGLGLFATLTTLVAGLLHGHYTLALATAPLAGALCGFLRYNFNPASIFLGDCGSLLVGFLLGVYGIIWSQKCATLMGMTAPLMALSIPLLDAALAVARRLVRGEPIFGADRRHIHHRLLDRGLTPRRVALVLYVVCGFAAALSLLTGIARAQYAGAIVVLFCAAAWTGIQHLGYAEFHVAGRLAHPRMFRRVLDGQIRLRALEDALDAAVTLDDCWTAVRSASLDFGFQHLTLRLDHTLYEELTASASDLWTLHIPLSETEYVKLGHGFQDSVPHMVVASFASVLRCSLERKLPLFHAGLLEDTPVRIVRMTINPHTTPPISATASCHSHDRPGTNG
jgi:UDP-GlcNAc:undecaprenyl-phosphate GlcNAc-1-phosphate transferase